MSKTKFLLGIAALGFIFVGCEKKPEGEKAADKVTVEKAPAEHKEAEKPAETATPAKEAEHKEAEKPAAEETKKEEKEEKAEKAESK